MPDSPKSIEIHPTGPIRGRIRPPGSKSITNRALICAALAEGESRLRGVLDSDDTRVMVAALRKVGVEICSPHAPHEETLPTAVARPRDSASLLHAEREDYKADYAAEREDYIEELRVVGSGGRVSTAGQPIELHVGNSGTSMRFLAAMLAACGGQYRLDGVPRMRERPIRDLLDALNQLGGDVRSESGNGCPPVLVNGQGLVGGTARVKGEISSQFLSGLLLAAPCSKQPVTLQIDGPLVSQPYVHMTLAVMRSFGVSVECDDDLRRFEIRPQQYQAIDYAIEPDASAASYFLAAAAITGGEVTVEGLSRDSLQGDVAFVEVLAQMGCEVEFSPRGITVRSPSFSPSSSPRPRVPASPRPAFLLRGVTVNMNAISDTVQTLAAVALFADGPTTMTGVGHIRHKETDRIGNLAKELRKLGATVAEFDDGLRITPPDPRDPSAGLHSATIETYDDHRMAMGLSLAGLRIPGVVIFDPGCTAKTYPEFFEDMRRMTAG